MCHSWSIRNNAIRTCPTPLDFFLWGFVELKVFRTAPSSIAQLTSEAREALASSDVNSLQCVLAKVVARIDKCIEAGGGHVES